MSLSITQILSISLEDLQAMSSDQLNELHSLLLDSKQKKAMRKLDLIEGILKVREKEEPKQEELVLVENSVKAPIKPKAGAKKPNAGKPKLTPKPKAEGKAEEPKAEAQEQPQEQPKAEDKPKAPKSLKKPEESKPDLSKMTQEELLEYAKQLQSKVEIFPEVINGDKVNFVKTDFESVKDIQQFLLKRPFDLFMFVDEKYDDNKKTCFLVLFVNSDITVILDRNRQKDQTLTLQTEQIDATHITFPKEKSKYKYSFYTKEKKEA